MSLHFKIAEKAICGHCHAKCDGYVAPPNDAEAIWFVSAVRSNHKF